MVQYTIKCSKCPREVSFTDSGEGNISVSCDNCKTLLYMRTQTYSVRIQGTEAIPCVPSLDDTIGPLFPATDRQREAARKLLNW